ncbi:MAG: hypothetical protein LBR60_07570 [Fibrobacter sp.]|nr:hypothetical protein [Fibrobacter sp.]
MILFLNGTGFSQVCPQPLLSDPFVVSAEGRFINRENSRTSIGLVWKHSQAAPDSFEITVAGKQSYLFVSHPDYRYMIFLPQKVKRELATHHLKDFIGNTPLRFDDLDLMANGLFLCPDSGKSPLIFSTAFSQMWYSIRLNQKEQPTALEMRGAGREIRKIEIQKWKNFDGTLLPAVIQVQDAHSRGTFWIRSAYKKAGHVTDPLLEKLESQNSAIRFYREGKIPLILKLN